MVRHWAGLASQLNGVTSCRLSASHRGMTLTCLLYYSPSTVLLCVHSATYGTVEWW